jgi:hypothetical protein
MSFGVDAQTFIARIDPAALDAAGVEIVETQHETFESFVKSKAGIDEDDKRVRIESFLISDDTGAPMQWRVKTKTAESLNAAFAGADSSKPVAGTIDRTGCDLIRTFVDALVATGDLPSSESVQVLPDSMAGEGGEWVPDFATAKVSDGVLLLQSRSMYIPTTFPLPEGFVPPRGVLGVHYIAVPHPDYIASLADQIA